jgi:hypothetical protein
VAHGVSAAWWHDLGPTLPATVEVTVRRGRNPGKQPGVSIRRRDLPHPDLVAVRDLWVTDLPLTVLEAAIAMGPEGSELLDRSLQRRVKFPAVYRAQCRNHGRRAWHVTTDRFVDDRRRQNALVNEQWTVLRFTWHDLVARPDGVVDEIRCALKPTRDHEWSASWRRLG